MRLIPAIILSISMLVAALIIVSIPLFFPPKMVGEGGAVDNNARIDIELLNGSLAAQQDLVNELRDQVDALENRIITMEAGASGPASDGGLQIVGPSSSGQDNSIANQYAQVVLVADRRNLNKGLTVPTSSWLVETFGLPAENLGDNCATMTNPRLAGLLMDTQVGPVRVKMLKPAVESLQVIMDKIKLADPDLYAGINTSGSLCVRFVRGSRSSVSAHSFGLAVDLNISGVLDTLGDGRTQLGLTILSDFFNADGWVWGAAYGREDSMHFEASKEKIQEWVAAGQI